MNLFSYILAYDSGSAPNPYFRYCTLTICKPKIRRKAQPGDWIIATGPARKHTNRKLVYAMRVSDDQSKNAHSADSAQTKAKLSP